MVGEAGLHSQMQPWSHGPRHRRTSFCNCRAWLQRERVWDTTWCCWARACEEAPISLLRRISPGPGSCDSFWPRRSRTLVSNARCQVTARRLWWCWKSGMPRGRSYWLDRSKLLLCEDELMAQELASQRLVVEAETFLQTSSSSS